MKGTHLLGEWYGCNGDLDLMAKSTELRAICMNAVTTSGLQIVGDAFHQFMPQGVTGTIILAESHLAIHTWPESGFVSIDVFVCNLTCDNTSKALDLYQSLKKQFKPTHENLSKVNRGELSYVQQCE
jgi:S-adenosylmethionine decarboxylase